jgi:hypothetical protein
MGGQTRYSRRHAPSWAATVGAMKANATQVYATCTRCGWREDPLPLDPIIEKFGAEFSLFDRRPRCRQPGADGGLPCTGKVLFLYRPPGVHGTPYRPCKTTL